MDDARDTAAPLLQVRDLRVGLGHPRVEAVRGIGFSLMPGEVLGLAGESGSGKTVSSMALTRLIAPDARPRYSGSVHLRGVRGNLLGQPASVLRAVRGRRIGYIFQEPSSCFNPLFSIGNHLDEALKVAGVPARQRPDRIRAALEEVGIEATAENRRAFPHAFSGGMLQRLAIACALAAGPEILVADEPTTALDTSTQKRIIELLQRINREHGMAILFISHNLALIRELAGRLVVMRDGLVVEEGPSAELLENPQHPYTRQLVAAIPRIRT